MKIYVDCDGVILNTEDGLFNKYYELKKNNPTLKRHMYLQNMDWEAWINQSRVIKEAIDILNRHDPKDADILTKVHSLSEARIKINYFRKNGVRNNIIIVPAEVSKAEVVAARGNLLVDDSFQNLKEWSEHGGYPVYFGSKESTYPTIESLESLFEKEQVKKLIFSIKK